MTNPKNKNLEELTEDEIKSLKELSRRGFKPTDIKKFIDALQQRKGNEQRVYTIGKEHIKIGVFGDTHIGNINYDSKLMDLFAKEIKKENVDFVLNLGDIVDGWYQNRPSALFEQNAIGFDAQLEMAVKEFLKIEKPIYFITGNHSWNTYIRGAGVEFGAVFEKRLNEEGLESYFLGNAEGNIKLKNGVRIKMLHPDGGIAYAISYRSQKIIESLSGGEKPNLLFIGHFHKMEYLFYRNIHAFQTGTFESQTKYMRGKNIPAHKGFWIIDFYSNKKGDVGKIIPRMYPVY